jgi:hypothetical protein
MSTPSRQTGWGAEENLLSFIIKQLDYLTKVAYNSGGVGPDPNLDLRITNLENNELKVTYFEIISGTSGSITIPTSTTINEEEFGLSGNAVLSKIDAANKPIFQSPLTATGTIVTASLDPITGDWVATGEYTDTNVALIYSLKLKTLNYSNLDYDFIIDETSNNITRTSELINDGDDGVSHFISLNDLPSNIVLYPTTAASSIPGYYKLVSSITDPSYNTTPVDVTTGAITTTSQLISSLVTSPNLLVGNPGIFNITTIGNIRRTSGSGTASFYFEIYKRTLAGSETLIATSDATIPVIDGGTYNEFSATALWNDGIFLPTDMVVMKFYGSRISGGSSPTYQFQFGGTKPVRTLVPIPLNVIPSISVEQLSNFSDVSYNPAIDTDSLMIKDVTNSLWKRFTIANLKALIRSTTLTGLVTTATTQVTETDSVVVAIGELQGQLNTKRTYLVKDSTPTSAVTGTTSITQLGASVFIQANTFSANDAMTLDAFAITKTGVLGTCNFRFHHNTSDTLTGATTIAMYALTALQLSGLMGRRYEINGGLFKCKLGGTISSQSDYGAFTVAQLSFSFDPTVDNYFFTTAQLSNAGDSVIRTQLIMLK